MNGWFLGAVLFMTNCNANATNSIAKLTNSIANGTNSIAKPTNSIANGTNSITKATNSIAKTCNVCLLYRVTIVCSCTCFSAMLLPMMFNHYITIHPKSCVKLSRSFGFNASTMQKLTFTTLKNEVYLLACL